MYSSKTPKYEALTMLRNWISIQSGLSPEQINDTSPLIGGDILDSFALISLAALVEELVGYPLNDTQTDARNFIDLRTIGEKFFQLDAHSDN